MFEWLPVFHGRYFTYIENIFVIAVFVFTTMTTIFTSVGLWLNRPKKKNLLKQSLAMYSSKPSIHIDEDDNFDEAQDVTSFTGNISPSLNSDNHHLRPKVKPVSGTRGGNACIWIAFFWVSLFPGAMATFGMIFPMWFAVFTGWIIMGLRIRHKERKDKNLLYHKLQQKEKIETYNVQVAPINHFYRKMKIFAVLLIFSLGLIFDGFCVNSFQENIGPIFGSVSLNSRLTRYFQLSKACPIGPPCHIYASLPEETSTSVFINAHTHESYETITITYGTDENFEDGPLVESVGFQLSGMENDGVRTVHSMLLQGLTPDTEYYFKISYADAVQATGRYRTLPDEHSTRDLVIVQGGDMGNTEASTKVAAAIAQMKPDVVVIGGDMAYDNGMCTCFFAWDFFLKDLNQINIASGRLVPVILAAGNHDMGIDPLARRIRSVDTEGPFYMVLFPQHSITKDGSSVARVPSLSERRTYYYHKIGKTILVSLDSGYLADIKTQADFMGKVLEDHKPFIKFAQYHCPIYYACDDLKGFEMELTKAQYDNWVPVFDKHKVALVFENDEHQLKRSFPLRNNVTHPNGTIYVGNGEWGTDEGYECHAPSTTGLYEYVEIVHHYWVVHVSPTEITNRPYNKRSEPITEARSQKVENYVS